MMKVSFGIIWDIKNSKVPNDLKGPNGLQITTKDATKKHTTSVAIRSPKFKICQLYSMWQHKCCN